MTIRITVPLIAMGRHPRSRSSEADPDCPAGIVSSLDETLTERFAPDLGRLESSVTECPPEALWGPFVLARVLAPLAVELSQSPRANPIAGFLDQLVGDEATDVIFASPVLLS